MRVGPYTITNPYAVLLGHNAETEHVNVNSATVTSEGVSSIYIYLIDLLQKNPVQ